jgi:NADH-quinone oxidoreductase subunit L
MAIAGIALAYVMYILNPLLPVRLAGQFGPIYRFLLNKWYFDELYNTIFVQPLIRLSRIFWQVGDVTLIDGVPNGLAELTSDGSRQAVKLQTGSLAVYAFAMLIGVVVLVAIFMLSR